MLLPPSRCVSASAKFQRPILHIGLRQLTQLLTQESLARAGEDGRMQPSLAESWTPEERSVRSSSSCGPRSHFTTATPLDADAFAKILPDSLKSFMGPIFSDVEADPRVGKRHGRNHVQARITVPARNAGKSDPTAGHSSDRHRSLHRSAGLDDIFRGEQPATTWASRRSSTST